MEKPQYVYDVRVVLNDVQTAVFEGVVGPTIIPSNPPVVLFTDAFGSTSGIVALTAGAIVRFENPKLTAATNIQLVQ